MRVEHLRVFFFSWLFMLCSDLTLKSNSWFFSDCFTGSRQQARKGLKCRREVFPLWIWGLWKALHHCPPSQGRCGSLMVVCVCMLCCFACVYSNVDFFPFTKSCYDAVTCLLLQGHYYTVWFVFPAGTWALTHWRQTIRLWLSWLWEEVCNRYFHCALSLAFTQFNMFFRSRKIQCA